MSIAICCMVIRVEVFRGAQGHEVSIVICCMVSRVEVFRGARGHEVSIVICCVITRVEVVDGPKDMSEIDEDLKTKSPHDLAVTIRRSKGSLIFELSSKNPSPSGILRVLQDRPPDQGPLRPNPIRSVLRSAIVARRSSDVPQSDSEQALSDPPMQDSREVIRSSVRRDDASHIRHRYFIPPEYKIIIPGRDDRMHDPPPICFTFHLASLDAGLRFPLHSTIEEILIRLNVLTKEEILSLAGLSPAVVPRTQTLGMAVRSSAIAKVIKERKERLITAARSSGLNIPPSPSVHSSDPGSDALLAIPLGGAHGQALSHEVQSHARDPDPLPIDNPPPMLTIEAGAASDPKDKGKGKSKKHKSRSRSGSKSKSKSSRGSKQKKKKARVEKEQPSEEEISAALHEIALRQKTLNEAREQTRIETSQPQREFSGTRVIPSWNISPESSIMKTRMGEDSLELYQVCILPHNQFALGSMPETRLEDIAAHDLMRAANIVHNLTLRGHHWRVHFMEAEARATRLEKEKTVIEANVRSKYETLLKSIESKLFEFETRARDSETSLKLAQEEAGKREALNSPDFVNRLLEARHKGAHDFKTSPIFDRLVVEKAAEFEVLGFYKCQSQLQKFGDFKPDFDPSKLDPELDGNGEQPFLEGVEEENIEGHEFGFLLQDSDPAAEEVPPQDEGAGVVEGDDLLDVASLLRAAT
ncbi:hypothetical protein DH2020_045060 [Rehmannia glutinosa]|uniref:Uncharacterized protein n=1 Tax=Rehmannia glutinosa TaxID=99300 RepID=A0ABR0UF69_REHGL